MIKSEIQNYIQQQQSQGVSREIITESLTKAGWPAADIHDSFPGSVQSSSSEVSNQQQDSSSVDETIYPIQFAWIWKTGITFFLAVFFSVVLLIFGYVNYYLVFLILYSPIHFIVLFLRRKNFHYELNSAFLNIRQGVINKQQRTVPYGMIQNVFVKQDLFDRVFGLASLAIENASQGAGAEKLSRPGAGAALCPRLGGFSGAVLFWEVFKY